MRENPCVGGAAVDRGGAPLRNRCFARNKLSLKRERFSETLVWNSGVYDNLPQLDEIIWSVRCRRKNEISLRMRH
ncbi:hypothetical protein I7I53_04303 [Histoplasma capsulatum var. duboisii H88]|uniref:Uncharacterized protein n=1 Tax=Ajellomyces capsulatus (strain H88) TaxID=544711 RepID=A0A8A1LQF2_AJEC8|nr:hypothetical protein I7I53_04303 [Histoplasma capsulatum var. duboisii H88]